MVIAFHITDLLVSTKRERAMKHVVSLLVLAFAMCLPASAEIKGCYERKYDAGVLARHPNQLVTYVVLRYGVPPNDQEEFVDDITFKVRGSKTIKISSYSCTGSKSKLTCKLDDPEDVGDAHHSGTFVLTETRDGVVVSPSTDLVLSDYRVGELTGRYTLAVKSNPEHKAFTLKKTKVDLESCGAG
jgi:hypothetical protein